jgi:hypothetical protein
LLVAVGCGSPALLCERIRQKLRTPSAIRGQHIELHMIGDEEGICADVSQIVVRWIRTIGPLSVDQRQKPRLASKVTRCTLGEVVSCCSKSNDGHILIEATQIIVPTLAGINRRKPKGQKIFQKWHRSINDRAQRRTSA